MLKIIPEPKKIIYTDNKFLNIDHIALGDCLLNSDVISDFTKACGMPGGKANVFFEADSSMGDEEYTLCIDDSVTVRSNGAAGQLYALQTLRQIIFQCGGRLPAVVIEDSPVYKLRGFMLDCGRYFFKVADVKAVIRRMALHKLNLLHLHLTEDQGWRVQIDAYPLLTRVGAYRKKTNFNHTPHGGFYTKADIKEIVDYAHSFCVKVMPEFDIPGHSRAAIAAYNDLTCFPRQLPVADHWGVKHDVLCVGKKSTMDFVFTVLDEFFDMFDDEYIHIGGDEVPKHRWDLCPACTKKRQELGLKDSDSLQMWFMNTVKDYCRAHGKQVFMWSWEMDDVSAIDSDLGFTKCGDTDIGSRPYIDTSTDAYYIDLPYGYVSLKDTAEHKPGGGNCLGVEGTLWSEYVPDMKKADKMSFPRTGCICETGWHGSCGWDKFEKKLDYYYSYLEKNNIGFTGIRAANPKFPMDKLSILWFERRQLAWEGLKNIFDDKKIEKEAKNKK